MMKFDDQNKEWFDPQKKLPPHFSMVYLVLKEEPDKIYEGCYYGLGAWSCRGYGRSVMTQEVEAWQLFELGVSPARDAV